MITETKLGPCLNKYRGSQLGKREVIFVLVSLILLSLIPFYIGLYKYLYGYAQFGSVAAKSWGIIWFVTSIFFMILIICYCFYRIYFMKLSISLHPSGIQIKKLFRKDLTILWNQISDLHLNQERNLFNRNKIDTLCILHTKDNKKLILKSSMIINSLELITQIKSSVYIHLYPRLQENYKNGKLLIFGPIQIQNKNIEITRIFRRSAPRHILLNDINFITIKSGYLHIKLQNQKHYWVRAAKIPNVELLLELIKGRTGF